MLRPPFAFPIIVIASLALPTLAQARCPAGESGCTMDNAAEKIQERVNQGVKDVEAAPTIREKVDATKETLKDCMNCGMDAVKEGFDKAGSFDEAD